MAVGLLPLLLWPLLPLLHPVLNEQRDQPLTETRSKPSEPQLHPRRPQPVPRQEQLEHLVALWSALQLRSLQEQPLQ